MRPNVQIACGTLACCVILLLCVRAGGQENPKNAAAPAAPTVDSNVTTATDGVPVGRLVDTESDLLECWLNVILSFAIGTLGSAAFHLALFAGFIGRDSREQLLTHLALNLREPRGYIPVLFWLFGGVTAAVFQAAQPSVLVPVQSFVLGMMWWSYVRQTVGSQSLRDLADQQPRAPAAQPGQRRPSASDAEVDIGPGGPVDRTLSRWSLST